MSRCLLLALLTSLALIATSKASADAKLATEICKPASERGTWPALWRIQDSDTEMYLFGTVHIVPYCVEWKSQKVTALLRKADVVYRENGASPNEEQQTGLEALATRLVTPSPGNSLGDFLQDEHIDGIAEIAGSDRSKVLPMLEVRPWPVYVALLLKTSQINARTLAERYEPPETGTEADTAASGSEKIFDGDHNPNQSDVAKDLIKRFRELADKLEREAGFREVDSRFKSDVIRNLDTPEEALRLFADLPDADVAEAVRSLICTHSSACATSGNGSDREKLNALRTRVFGLIVRAWLAGDQADLATAVTKLTEYEMLLSSERLLIERNRKWVIRLDQAMHSTPGLIVVAAGAAHFVGEGSVLALLADKGWHVERVE